MGFPSVSSAEGVSFRNFHRGEVPPRTGGFRESQAQQASFALVNIRSARRAGFSCLFSGWPQLQGFLTILVLVCGFWLLLAYLIFWKAQQCVYM